MPIGGFIDSVFGGNERAKAKKKERQNARDNYKYNKGVWRSNKKRLKADRNQLVKEIETQERNANAIADYQDQTNQLDYNNRLAIRDREIQLQNQQYQKSQRLFNQQGAYNRRAEADARRGAKQNFNDEMKSIGYQRQGLQNEMSRFLQDEANTMIGSRNAFQSNVEQRDLGRTGNASTLADVQRQVQLGQARAQQEFNQQRDEAAFANQDAIIEALQAQGAAEARGVSGKTAGRLAQNALGALGRNQAQITSQLLGGSTRLKGQLDQLQNQLEVAQRTQKLDNLKLDQGLMTARRDLKLDTKRSRESTAAEQRDFALNKEILLANQQSVGASYENTLAEIATKAEGARIQALANLMLPPVDPPMPVQPLPTPRAEFTYPRKLKDYDFGPEPILNSVADVSNIGVIAQGVDSAIATVAAVAGIPSPPMSRNNPGTLSGANPGNFNLGSFGNLQPLGFDPFNMNR